MMILSPAVMSKMELRYLSDTDDRYAVSRIYAESWKYAYKGIIPDDYLNGLKPERWQHSFEAPGRYSVVMTDGERLAGTSSFSASRFEELALLGEIISLYLLPEYIGRGFGRQLLSFAVDELMGLGYKDIFLWVLEDNHRARSFYEKNGFVCSGVFRVDTIGGKALREVRYDLHCTG